MLYKFYETGYYATTPLRMAALWTRDFWNSPLNFARDTAFGRRMFASADLFSNLTRRYPRPAWGIESVQIEGQTVGVQPTEVWSSPWVKLTHFARDATDMRRAGRTGQEPVVLIVAPMSGHYATLLRGTVQAFLQDHEVYITDWSNARDVSVLDGRFDFHDYLDQIQEILRVLGNRPHVVAVCQPGPAVLAQIKISWRQASSQRTDQGLGRSTGGAQPAETTRQRCIRPPRRRRSKPAFSRAVLLRCCKSDHCAGAAGLRRKSETKMANMKFSALPAFSCNPDAATA